MKGPKGIYKVCLTIALFGSSIFTPLNSQASSPPIIIYNASYDTSKRDGSSYFERQEHLRNSGKTPFYGTWSDYFSSYLEINTDSTFKFSWGYNLKGSWTEGKWQRKKDTFYFREIPVYDTLQYLDAVNGMKDSLALSHYSKPRLITESHKDDDIWLSVQNSYPMPDKLCYYKNKLFKIDSKGNLIKGKIPSPYMGKKNPAFKTLYFREKRFNLNYFDSNYYYTATKRRFKMGFGINVILQPVPGYRIVGSFGFTLSPRYIFERKSNSYLSLGIPLTTGFSRFDDSASIDVKLGTMIDLPLILNYNYEFGSVKDRGSRFGYFAGGGFAYHYNYYTAAKDHATITQQVNGFGPLANAGIRYSLKKYRIQNLELRLSYMKMIVESKSNIFGIGFIVNF